MRKASVIDYALDGEDVLLRDLFVDELKLNSPKEGKEDAFADSMSKQIEEIGWIISNCDEHSSEATTAQDEFDRLNVLKKYSGMDLNSDDTLQKMTSMASTMLGHDYSWVLLMDLRKSWIVSSQGLGGMKECPRNSFFPCAHALRSKNPFLLVEDLTEDPRFIQSPFAIGPLGARFYAAAPLISPEGFRIGVFGVASQRPATMSLKDQQILSDFADLAMRHLVERRSKLDLEENLKKAVACTSHDIMTPLMGLQLSLASLKDDKELSGLLTQNHRELLATADNCVTTMCQLGTTAMQNVHEGLAVATGGSMLMDTSVRDSEECQISDLVERLHLTLDPIEKSVPLMITVEPSTPSVVTVSDLKVFRSALAVLCLACARTNTGFVLLRIYMENGSLVFACESSMPPLLENEAASFMDATNEDTNDTTISCLRLAAKTVRSLGGKCDYRPSDDVQSSVLWFKVPCDAGAQGIISESEPSSPTLDAATLSKTVDGAATIALTRLDDSSVDLKPPFSTVNSSASLHADFADAVLLARDQNLPRKKKVLVIDDSLVVRKSLDRALSTKFGYQVTLAEDGREGLACLQEAVFDFVLCDFLMPVMDGWDCVQQYRQWEAHHRPWFRQLIIGMSAHAGDKDVQRANEFGMDSYRCKPVTIQTLSSLTEDMKIIHAQKQLDYLLPMFGSRQKSGMAGDSPRKRKRTTSMLCLSSDMLPLIMNPLDDGKSDAVKTREPRDDGKPVCLVCRSSSAESPWSTIALRDSFQQHGWKIEVVQSSDEATTRLKERNYGAVLVESEMAPLSGVECITQFRQWEATNRVNRQKNVLLQFPFQGVLAKAMRGGGTALVQPPAGFDGVIGAGSVWGDFEGLVRDGPAGTSTAEVANAVIH